MILPAIKKIRDSVAFWTATPKRVEKFEEMAKFLKVLGLDCKTRWNSTYKMLSIAIPYEAVFSRASRVEKLYDCAPSKEEWAFARQVVDRLKMFDEITKVFSGTDYVTANIQLLKICEAKEMSKNMIEKFDKYWKDIQGPMGIAIVLDPRFKVDYLLGFFETLLGQNSDQCLAKVQEVKESLFDLMKYYEVDEHEGPTESSGPSLDTSLLSAISARVASRRPAMTKVKNELHRYLEDELVPFTAESFQILDWWKVTGTRYPTLRKIARDIFAIPVSTVASESAFSTSGRILSEHRSRLTPEILEALILL
ncbi:hypothetical protein U9M48_027109 [Paspalum notatum var. saurae]|uniref:Transposase n=1 Tax=Paspalum notatum var. saurae TaxID=547442 RepID=A0AAQ3TS95_PASNO